MVMSERLILKSGKDIVTDVSPLSFPPCQSVVDRLDHFGERWFRIALFIYNFIE